ncbi:ty3-gypsy retrotransposon protein [Cucumis melo var. makuwa]|uniref:Ty3-gypsy retrotransposon protein n=1 Tax=Cucumis melo var. makuwa TaxID=1194695 RepID=A0A5D3CVB2_CUCMM|nr:ty3-gypsy retrotransposon protein [Cucumis melo var. makuwa]
MLQDNKEYVKFSVCEFWRREVTLLGHVVTTEGVLVDFQGAEVIGSEEITCFHAYFTLLIPDVVFETYYDTSELGCALMRKGKVIAYDSKRSKKHKCNYATHDVGATVVLAVKI